MKTKYNLLLYALIKELIITSSFLSLGIISALSQNVKMKPHDLQSKDEDWAPILRKHNFDIIKYDLQNAFRTFYVPVNTSAGMKADAIWNPGIEFGTIDSLINGVLCYKSARSLPR